MRAYIDKEVFVVMYKCISNISEYCPDKRSLKIFLKHATPFWMLLLVLIVFIPLNSFLGLHKFEVFFCEDAIGLRWAFLWTLSLAFVMVSTV